MAAEGPVRIHDRLRGMLRVCGHSFHGGGRCGARPTGIAIVEVQRRQLVSHRRRSRAASRRPRQLFANSQASDAPRDLGGDDDSLVQIVGPNGMVIAASHNILGDPPVAQAPTSGDRDRRQTVGGLVIDDDASRLLSRRVETGNGPVVVHVAHTLDEVDDSVATLARSLVPSRRGSPCCARVVSGRSHLAPD
jgi:hypothetical protein